MAVRGGLFLFRRNRLRRWILLASAAYVLLKGFAFTSWAKTRDIYIRINVPVYQLAVFLDQKLYKVYPVAVGKPSEPTPLGVFFVDCVVKNPTWYPRDKKTPPRPPGPDNPLGKWWIGLNIKGYGIHGNNNESSIGHSVSKGCVRMSNRDIETLAKMVSVGTLVEIIYKPFLLICDDKGECNYIRVYPDIYNLKPPLPDLLEKDCGRYNPGRRLYKPVLEDILRKNGLAPLPWQKKVYLNGREIGEGYESEGAHYLPAALWDLHVACRTTVDNRPPGRSSYVDLGKAEDYREIVRTRYTSESIILFTPHLLREGECIPLPPKNIEGRLYLDVASLAREAGLTFRWEGYGNIAALNGIQMTGLVYNGTFWAETSLLSLILPCWGWIWDGERMEIRIADI